MKIEELKKDLFLGDFGDQFEGYNSGYIGDIITEIADNNVDIYNSDLLDWLKNNYSIVEEANDMMGTPSGIIEQCQQGQFYQYEHDLYENLVDIITNRIYQYIEEEFDIHELTDEQIDEISYLNLDDNNKRLEDLFNEVKEILEKEEEK